jgi:hypothetical protein
MQRLLTQVRHRNADEKRAVEQLARDLGLSVSELTRQGWALLREHRLAERKAAEAAGLIRTLRDRLGSAFKGDLIVEKTPKGRVCVHRQGTTYWQEGDDLVAARVHDGQAQFAVIGPDGQIAWADTAPLNDGGRPEAATQLRELHDDDENPRA